jgi:hypothetical protein
MPDYAATWMKIGWFSRTRGRLLCIACDRPARWRQTLTDPSAVAEVTSYCEDHAFPGGMIVSGL